MGVNCMRGTIIMWSGERGVVAASGARYEFDISLWQGACAPRTDMSVEMSVENGVLSFLRPVSEQDLAQEMLKQKMGKAAEIGQAVLRTVGNRVAIAYGVFAISALFLDFVSVHGLVAAASYSLSDTISVLSGGGSGGMLLVLLALATIVVPYFLKHKYAVLSLCLPLVVTLYGGFKYYQLSSTVNSQIEKMNSAVNSQIEQLGSMLGNASHAAGAMKGAAVSLPYSLGIGAYLAFAAAAFIAFFGIKGYLVAMRDGAPQNGFMRSGEDSERYTAPVSAPSPVLPQSSVEPASEGVATYCIKCGNKLTLDDVFCGGCATKKQ